MGFRGKFGISIVLVATSALASDLAVLKNGFSIRHERRQQFGNVTRLYLSTDGTSYTDVAAEQVDHFEKDLSPAPTQASRPKPLAESISEISSRHKIDPDLITSVIRAESGFNPRAVSRKGAQGLMQLMPQTATKMGVNDAFDPSENVEGGTRYLRELLVRYNFDLIKALAAYNAGPLRVEQYRGVPPYRETRAYIARIVRDFNRKKIAEQKAATKTARGADSAARSTSTTQRRAVSSPEQPGQH